MKNSVKNTKKSCSNACRTKDKNVAAEQPMQSEHVQTKPTKPEPIQTAPSMQSEQPEPNAPQNDKDLPAVDTDYPDSLISEWTNAEFCEGLRRVLKPDYKDRYRITCAVQLPDGNWVIKLTKINKRKNNEEG